MGVFFDGLYAWIRELVLKAFHAEPGSAVGGKVEVRFGDHATAAGSTAMAEALVDQTGNCLVRMYDSAGKETDSYDKMTGISYEVSDPSKLEVVDDDEEPKDAALTAIAATEPDTPVIITCRFDGDPGDGERPIVLQSEPITIREPEPGEAVSGEFTVQFHQVEPAPAPA
jgi:hypothetical protein